MYEYDYDDAARFVYITKLTPTLVARRVVLIKYYTSFQVNTLRLLYNNHANRPTGSQMGGSMLAREPPLLL